MGRIGDTDTLLLVPTVPGLDPSATPTRRGSVALGEVGCWCLFDGVKGIDIRDSMFLAEVEADVLRGIGILEDLDGREFMTTPRRLKGL